jgi:hypothetical protein
MSLQSLAYLKQQFRCNRKPTQKDFIDLIDTLAALPNTFCDTTPLFDIIKECDTSGITVSGSMYIIEALSAAEASFGGLSASNAFFTNLTALSSVINVLNITQYELSGFNVTGDVTISGSVTADMLAVDCGNSDQWCSTYTTVCANSAQWGDFCNNTIKLNQVSACNGTISITGDLNLNGYSISGVGNNSITFISGAKLHVFSDQISSSVAFNAWGSDTFTVYLQNLVLSERYRLFGVLNEDFTNEHFLFADFTATETSFITGGVMPYGLNVGYLADTILVHVPDGNLLLTQKISSELLVADNVIAPKIFANDFYSAQQSTGDSGVYTRLHALLAVKGNIYHGHGFIGQAITDESLVISPGKYTDLFTLNLDDEYSNAYPELPKNHINIEAPRIFLTGYQKCPNALGDTNATTQVQINGPLTARYITTSGGNNLQWNTAYTTVCANSSVWNGDFCSHTIKLGNISACNGLISLSGSSIFSGNLTANSVYFPSCAYVTQYSSISTELAYTTSPNPTAGVDMSVFVENQLIGEPYNIVITDELGELLNLNYIATAISTEFRAGPIQGDPGTVILTYTPSNLITLTDQISTGKVNAPTIYTTNIINPVKWMYGLNPLSIWSSLGVRGGIMADKGYLGSVFIGDTNETILSPAKVLDYGTGQADSDYTQLLPENDKNHLRIEAPKVFITGYYKAPTYDMPGSPPDSNVSIVGDLSVTNSISSNQYTLDYTITSWDDISTPTFNVYTVIPVNSTALITPANGSVQALTVSGNITLSSVSTPNSAQYHLVTLNIAYTSGNTITWDDSILYGRSFSSPLSTTSLSVCGVNTIMLEYRWHNTKPIAHILDNPEGW